METNSENSGDERDHIAEIAVMVGELRLRAIKQILFGLGWWVASAIAMYVALGSPGDSYYWFGGALGSLFHWQRAFKLIRATYEVGAKKLVSREIGIIALGAAIVIGSTSLIVPEYFKVTEPTIGTCWALSSGDTYGAVACWSSNASLKIVSFASTAEGCPISSDGYFKPSGTESRYSCLEEI